MVDTAGEQRGHDPRNGSQQVVSGPLAGQDVERHAAADASARADAISNDGGRYKMSDDPAIHQASPFAAAAATAALEPQPAAATDDALVVRRLPLVAASRSVTTGLESGGSPATDTTIQAGAAAASQLGQHTTAEGSGFITSARQAVHSGPTGPGAVTPATSLSTGLGSNPSVHSDQTLPPAPSGELAAVFATADRHFTRGSSSGDPAPTPRMPASDASGVVRSASVPGDAGKAASIGMYLGATPGTSISTGLPDGVSIATDETLTNIEAGGRDRQQAGHPPPSPSASAAAMQRMRQLRRNSSSGRRTGTSDFLSSLSRVSPVPSSPPAAHGDDFQPPTEPSDVQDATPLLGQDPPAALPGGESHEPVPERNGLARSSPPHTAHGITTIHEQGSGGSSSAPGASHSHQQASGMAASQPAPEEGPSSQVDSAAGGSPVQGAVPDVAAEAPPDGSSRGSELAGGGSVSGDSSGGSSVTSPFVPTPAQLASMPKLRREAIEGRRQQRGAQPKQSPSPSAAVAPTTAAPPAHSSGADSASAASAQPDPDTAVDGDSSSEGSVSPPPHQPESQSAGHDTDEYPDLDEAFGADEPLVSDDAPAFEDAASPRDIRRHSVTSRSPASTAGQEARVPSIGSVIASLSIGSGSGATIVRQLASLREQRAASGGRQGAADAAATGRPRSEQAGRDVTDAHQTSEDASPVQHSSGAASLVQRQLAQLQLNGGGTAQAEQAPRQAPIQQWTSQQSRGGGLAAGAAEPEPAASQPVQPEGKQLRVQSVPAAPVPPPAAASAASAAHPEQQPDHAQLASGAPGPAGAAAAPSPQGDSGSASPRGFASPEKYFQQEQPHFTLGAHSDAAPAAKRRQLPPAAQAGLATGPQPMPPTPWPLPGVTPPLRHAQPPPSVPVAPSSTDWQRAESSEMSFMAVSDAWERRTSPADRGGGTAQRPLTRTRSSGRSGRPASGGSPVAAATATTSSMVEGPGPPAGGVESSADEGNLAAVAAPAAASSSLGALLGAVRSGTPDGPRSDAITGSSKAGGSHGAGGVQSEHDLGWRRQKRHFFILTHAGKPVFTRYGEEGALASFTALLQALAAFVANRGDSIQSIRSGRHMVVVSQRGPLLLVAVSSGGEPASTLRRRLDLLHGQVTLIVTNAIDRLFTKNPRYDGRSLLVGTGPVLRALAAEVEVSPWGLLPAFPPAPLPAPLRAAAVHALKASIKDCSAMYGVLLCDAGVVALASQGDQPRLHPSDLLLLATFLRANDSLRQGESMCPVCLPRLNPGAFLHAYIAFLHPTSGLAVALLSAAPDAFLPLSKGRAVLEAQLNQHGVTAVLIEAAMQPGGGRLQLSNEAAPAGDGGSTAPPEHALTIPAGPLLHFVYHVPARRQFLAPASQPADTAQEFTAAVARLHAAVFGDAATDGEAGPAAVDAPSPSRTLSAGASASGKVLGAAMRAASGGASEPSPAPRQRMHFTAESSHAALAYAGPEFVLYAVLDPLVAKGAALDACNALCAWLKPRQAHLFLPL